MKLSIRAQLVLRFTLIVALILVLFSASIYYFSATYRKSEFYTRLRDKANTTARFLIKVNEVDLELLKIIDRNTITALYNEKKVVIYNSKNELMYDSLDDEYMEVTPQLLEEIREKGEVAYAIGEQEVIGLIYENGNDRFVVLASALDKYGKRKLNNLKWVLLIGFVSSIIITVLAAMAYAGRALKPMSDVVKQVDQITISNLHMRVNEGNGTDEIAALAITFNNMLQRLNSAFQMQRSFVSNASHELRTPLTSITGQIEVSLMNKRTPEEYEAILNSILDDIRNLNSMSNGLLDLAKASSDISEIKLSHLRVDELLWETRSELLRRFPAYSIEIIFDEHVDDEVKLMVSGNEHLLKTAIINLMDNGCKYSPQHRVVVKLMLSGNKVSISFTDNGIGISGDDVKNIFNPFFRSLNAKPYPGHGLGLSLTERIIHVHGGAISVDSVINKGTTVTIELPGVVSLK